MTASAGEYVCAGCRASGRSFEVDCPECRKLKRKAGAVEEVKPKKGEYWGACNRTACNRPATWWSSVERAHYCEHCAVEINKWVPAHVPKLVPVVIP